jgi:enamine deaminase RidA (YjgF/YER057c/UK114 family)
VRPRRWQLEPVSISQECKTMIERKNPSSLAPPVGRYHHLTIIPAGSDILAIAGQVGLDEKGHLPATVEEQLANALANVTRILQSEGLDHRAVFKINMWLTQPVERERYVEIWREFHSDEPPASMFAYVSAMIRPEYLVEVEAWAARPAREAI